MIDGERRRYRRVCAVHTNGNVQYIVTVVMIDGERSRYIRVCAAMIMLFVVLF